MKILYLIFIFISILFLGCSSTYRLSDFSSKDKFYEDFNSFAKDKSVKVTFINDSSFNINNRTEIKNDSLYSIEEDNLILTKLINSSEIKEMSYNKFRTSAFILMKNDEKYDAHYIEFHNDSVYFSYDKRIIKINKIAAIDKIKNISYKNHWLGIPVPFFVGFVGGTLLGALIVSNISIDKTNTDLVYIFFVTPVIGSIIGGIWGWIDGITYTYEFSVKSDYISK
jgi:hypothetical protein